jgi:hypothetical protein
MIIKVLRPAKSKFDSLYMTWTSNHNIRFTSVNEKIRDNRPNKPHGFLDGYLVSSNNKNGKNNVNT